MRKIICLGFTLIELMLALAISAILIAIGYPSYSAHEAHAQRERAIVALMQLSARMEVYLSDHNTYHGATLHHLQASNLVKGLDYRLKIEQASQYHYVIKAIPLGVQAKRDKRCGSLILSDTNQQKISGDGDVNQCWR